MFPCCSRVGNCDWKAISDLNFQKKEQGLFPLWFLTFRYCPFFSKCKTIIRKIKCIYLWWQQARFSIYYYKVITPHYHSTKIHFSKNCGKIHNLKFTVRSPFKCTPRWHGVSSRGCATIIPHHLQDSLHLAKLKLSIHNTSPFLPTFNPSQLPLCFLSGGHCSWVHPYAFVFLSLTYFTYHGVL